MSRKTLGIILIVAGGLLALLSLAADVISIGTNAGFGPYQIFGTVFGLILATGGAWLVIKKKNP